MANQLAAKSPRLILESGRPDQSLLPQRYISWIFRCCSWWECSGKIWSNFKKVNFTRKTPGQQMPIPITMFLSNKKLPEKRKLKIGFCKIQPWKSRCDKNLKNWICWDWLNSPATVTLLLWPKNRGKNHKSKQIQFFKFLSHFDFVVVSYRNQP